MYFDLQHRALLSGTWATRRPRGDQRTCSPVTQIHPGRLWEVLSSLRDKLWQKWCYSSYANLWRSCHVVSKPQSLLSLVGTSKPCPQLTSGPLRSLIGSTPVCSATSHWCKMFLQQLLPGWSTSGVVASVECVRETSGSESVCADVVFNARIHCDLGTWKSTSEL